MKWQRILQKISVTYMGLVDEEKKNGYLLGNKKTFEVAMKQLIDNLMRVGAFRVDEEIEKRLSEAERYKICVDALQGQLKFIGAPENNTNVVKVLYRMVQIHAEEQERYCKVPLAQLILFFLSFRLLFRSELDYLISDTIEVYTSDQIENALATFKSGRLLAGLSKISKEMNIPKQRIHNKADLEKRAKKLRVYLDRLSTYPMQNKEEKMKSAKVLFEDL